MGKRKHRSKSEWQELIEQQASSDLNAAAFCLANGLSSKTFYRHRKLLAGQSTDLTSGPFITVQKKIVKPLSPSTDFTLSYREIRLHLTTSTDPVWVAELIRALT